MSAPAIPRYQAITVYDHIRPGIHVHMCSIMEYVVTGSRIIVSSLHFCINLWNVVICSLVRAIMNVMTFFLYSCKFIYIVLHVYN